MRYTIKVTLEDGTERTIREKTEIRANDRALAIYNHNATAGRRATARVYRDGKLLNVYNRARMNRMAERS